MSVFLLHEDQRSSIPLSGSTPDLGNPPDISKYLENFSPAALISDWTIAGGKGWISAEEFISFRLRFGNIISFQIILMIRSHSLDFAIRQFTIKKSKCKSFITTFLIQNLEIKQPIYPRLNANH